MWQRTACWQIEKVHPEIYDRSVSLQASRRDMLITGTKGRYPFWTRYLICIKVFTSFFQFHYYTVDSWLPEAPNQTMVYDEKTPLSKKLCESILSYCKGALIAESFSLWLKSPKKGAKNILSTIHFKEKKLRDLAPFFEIWAKVKNFLRWSHLYCFSCCHVGLWQLGVNSD